MHTCRKWRRIAFASQEALHLRLFCTHGTPVQKTLHFWPAALPIVVEYGGLPTLDPPAPMDEDNIIAALKQSHRVISISLTVTRSLIEKLFAIEKTFSEIQDVVLLSRDDFPLIRPITFRWGQGLRRLHSTRVGFLALHQFLSSSTNLTDLQLREVFSPFQFPTEMLMKVLSKLGRSQLRSLSLHFSSTVFYHCSVPPSSESIFLPVLTRLNYQGGKAYLMGIVARIHAPFLKDIKITFFDSPMFAAPIFKNFAHLYKSRCRAHMLPSDTTIAISLTQPGVPTRIKLQMQKSPKVQIRHDFFSFFPFNYEGELCISTTDLRGMKSLKLLNQFTGKYLFHLDTNYSILFCNH